MRALALASALGIAGVLAACNAPDTLDGYELGSGAPPPGTMPAQPSESAGSATAINPATGVAQEVPAEGPGSTSSAARQFFIGQVFPAIGTCVTCHATGTAGAPKFMAPDAAGTYAGLDARGLIVEGSLFMTMGTHAAGVAPAMDENQLTLTTQWLALEALERVGQAAPVNILEKMGDCLDEALFDAIGFDELRTQRRDGENANNCTGCNEALCRTCHTGGDGNFYMAAGSVLDRNTFLETKKPKFIVKYLGLNGTTPVASNAIALKGQATATDKRYSHPMYTIGPQMQTRIDSFVNAAILKYQNQQCGQ